MKAKLKVYLSGELILTKDLDPDREYTAGRHESNDIQLEDKPGVSRKHFKISCTDGRWGITVISKFSKVHFLGQDVDTIDVDSDLVFSLEPYEFHVELQRAPNELAPQDSSNLAQSKPSQLGTSSSSRASNSSLELEDTAGWDEATRISAGVVTVPFVRIFYENSKQSQTLQLEGNLWIGGRDPLCQIAINDQHASRKQFEIAKTNKGYFLTDLGSVNGTLLNNSPLIPNEPTPLRSGDVISVLSSRIYFELRDPEFQNKLQNVDPNLRGNLVPLATYGAAARGSGSHSFDAASGFAPQLGEGGNEDLGLVDNRSWKSKVSRLRNFDWKRHKIKVITGSLIVLVLIFAMTGGNKGGTPTKTANATQNPLAKLTPDQRQLVKDSYQLARNLILQRKFVMALGELKKIHQLVPVYKSSREMELECKAAVKEREQADEFARLKEQREQMQKKISQVLATCKAQINTNTTVADMQQCLLEVMQFDPNNQQASNLINQVQEMQEEKKVAEQRQEDYRREAQDLKRLCERAQGDYQKGDLFEARKEYEICIHSRLPDPSGIKNQVSRNLASINAKISSDVDQLLSQAKQQYKNSDFAGALATMVKISRIDPENPDYKSLRDKVTQKANDKMKSLYDDASLEESLGQVNAAMDKWQRILDYNLPNSTFYIRASKKLKQYGALQ